MRKYLLPKDGTYFKANLHSHSTCSDGRLTPEELKKIYKEHGYSVLAYTDHDLMIDHSDLADEDFLPLLGYEVNVDMLPSQAPVGYKKSCHMCFISLTPDNSMVCFDHDLCKLPKFEKYRDKVKFDPNEPDYKYYFSPECINFMANRARKKGFFVTHNHPVWSHEEYPDYTAYVAMSAVEIVNYSSISIGFDCFSPTVYDDIVRAGHRIGAVASDDNHNAYPLDTPYSDSFGGFTMIKAEKLDYPSIANALVKGNYYASMGPEIYDLWYEDGKVHITTSPAATIRMNTCTSHAGVVHAENGKLLTEATFEIRKMMHYFRFTVTDVNGKHACTSAYYLNDLTEL